MPKAPTRIKMSDAQLKSELFKLFNSGKTAKTNLYELLRTKATLGKQRYFKAYDLAHAEWATTQGKAQVEQTVENAKEALKIGLKSKLERQLELQKMLEPDYRVEEIVGVDVKSGKILRAMRCLTPSEARNIHVELSKMDGSYAAEKKEVEISTAKFEGFDAFMAANREIKLKDDE